jgi:hypothetical protein
MSGSEDTETAERGGAANDRGRTRAQALGAAAIGGAALGAGALLGRWVRPEQTAARPSRATDVRVLNFLLILEEAQAAFYDAALRGGALRGELLEFAGTVAPQEREHVAFIRKRLGRDAGSAQRFEFTEAVSDAGRFRTAAIGLEEATAAAYIGQGASLTREAVQDAASIVAVEARHAAWIRDLAGTDPAPRAADPGRSADDVLGELRKNGFMR